MKTWSPSEVFYVEYLNRNIRRLECLEIHCRYYLGREREVKPAAFIFFPKELLPLINKYKYKLPGKRRIEKVAKKLGAVMLSVVRTFALREMRAVLGDNDTYRFIVGKFGELTTTARHYMDLVTDADRVYPNIH